MTEQKLLDFIKNQNIAAEHIVFQTSCHSVEEAAQSANAKPEDFVKNICLIDDSNNLVVAIIPGTKRLDIKKTAVVAQSKKLRFATADEILERTGYPMGGTPSFGYPAAFFIDENVIFKDIVFSGGGSQNSLTKISPREIERVTKAKIANLTKS